MKKIFFLIIIGLSFQVLAQKKPVINSISPTRASVNEVITINGTGFPTGADLKVLFGGVPATNVVSSSDALIEVRVPANAPHAPITIVNTSTDFLGTSKEYFGMAFGGETFQTSAMSTVTDINTNEVLLYDICDCDFDGDGNVDLAVTSQQNNGGTRARRRIYRNTSTINNISLSNTAAQNLGTKPSTSVICADFNGDGLPELAATQRNDQNDTGAETWEVYVNRSTPGNISFLANPDISNPLPRDTDGNVRSPFQIRAGDMDSDGKNDVVVSNSDRWIHIYLNATTPSTFGFVDLDSIEISTDVSSIVNIQVADINKDNKPDIIAAPNNEGSVFIFLNNSTTGNLVFADPIELDPSGQDQIRGLSIVDLNNDGFLDIVASDANTSGTNSQMIIFPNETTEPAGAVSFGTATQFDLAGSNSFGLDAGDLNGDGLIDLAIAPGASTSTQMDIAINDGDFDFTISQLPVNNNIRSIQITDLDNDAKPDLAFTSNSLSNQVGNLSYIENNNCLVPEITPSTGSYCPGNSFILTATKGVGVTYIWQVSVDGGTFNNAADTDNTLDLSTYNATNSVTVRVRANTNDGCSQVSEEIEIQKNDITPNAPAFTASDISLCVGEELTLSSSTTADEYIWSGPNNFSQTTTGGVNTVTVTSDAQPINSGRYSLVVRNTGGCNSSEVTALVTVDSPPTPTVSINGLANFCEGGNTELNTTDYSGFNFQWNNSSGAISGETESSITVSSTENYSVTLIDPTTNCQTTSQPITITEVERPISTISSDTEICVDVALDLTGQTTSSNANFTLEYSWDFQDNGGNSIGTDNVIATSFTFTSAGNYTANLTTGYQELDNCTNTVTQNITVSDPPTASIAVPDGEIQKCPSDSILLEAPAGMVSYTWSNGLSSQSIYGKTAQGDNDSTYSVTFTTNIGCVITIDTTISNFPNSGLTISSPNPDAVIANNELIIPEGQLSIDLEAGGGSGFSWEPADIFDNPTASSVTAFPKTVSTLITLSGEDVNGCNEQTSLTLIANSVVGRRSFSPDGNGILDCWEILNTSTLEGCTVYIFDKRGKNIFTADSPFTEDCVWDGTAPNGQQVPEGVYYYVMKCSDSQYDQSGSILLARTTGN